MNRLLTFLLTALLAFSVGWAETETVTTTISSANATGTTLTWSNSNLTFSLTQKPSSTSYSVETSNYARGLSTGAKTGTHVLTSNQSFSNVTKVEVVASTNGNNNTLSVKVGGTTIGTTQTITSGTGSANATYTFDASSAASGKIAITIDDENKTVWVKTITVTYSTGGTTEPCATPVFNPDGGTYTDAATVTITSATNGATIYYTTDGTTPTTNSSSISNGGSVVLYQSCTLKAMAVLSGMENSAVATSQAYTINSGGTPSSSTIYRRVSSINDLVPSRQCIIVYENGDNSAAMGAFNGSTPTTVSNFAAVTGLSVTDHRIDIADADGVLILTLAGTQNAWTLSNNGYITGSNNTTTFTFPTSPVAGSASYWTISADEGTIQNNLSTTRYIRYYTSNPSFRHYTTDYGEWAYLYVQDTNPTLTVSDDNLTLPDIPYDAAAGASTSSTFTVTGSNLEDDVTITYTGADFTVTPTSISPVDGSVDETITVTYNGTSTDPVTCVITVTCGNLTRTVTVTAKKQTPPPAVITVAPATLNINDSGENNTLTITGQYVNGNINASLATTTDWTLSPETFGNTGGTATVAYTGRALSASNTVTAQAANDNTVSAQATVNYLADLYIVTDNGQNTNNGYPSNNWDFAHGVHMTYENGVYTGEFQANQATTFIVFTRKLVETEPWGTRLAFGPSSNGDWWLPASGNGSGNIDLNDSDPIRIQYPGLYHISINANAGTFTITSTLPTVATPTFSPAPGTYTEAQTVTISCATDGATISYSTDGGNTWTVGNTVTVSETTTIIAKATKEGMNDSEPASATYTIHIPGEGDFVLVTSIGDLAEGDEIIIVNSGGDGDAKAMAGQRDNNRAATDVEVLGQTVADDYPDMQIIHLEGDNTDGWYFNVGDVSDAYLYAASNTSNHLKTQAEKNDNAKASIDITTAGVATIQFQGSYSHNWLRYNSGSNIFSCYASGQQPVYIYKREAAKVSSPVITPAGGTANKKFDDVEVTMTAADGCIIYYTLDGSVPTVDSDVYDPNNKPVVAYGSAPVTVKAIAVDGDGNISKVATVTYYWDNVTVNISPASGRVSEPVTVTITPTPSDATVTYTINGGASQTYTGPFTVNVDETNHEVTVEATAVKGQSTATASVTYNYKSDKVYSIAEFKELDEGEEVTFMNPVTVLFDYSQNSASGQEYIWVKDRTGYMQLFIRPQFKSDFAARYENSDVIPPGFKVKKGYHDEGQYYQAQCFEWHDTFRDTTLTALADPEQVLLSELLDNPADYNDRYLYINKLQVSNVNGLSFRIAADENGDNLSEVQGGTAIVGYNKYNSPAWKDKEGNVVGVTLPSDNKFYNVTFIFQKWQNGYEIMPIKFTEWEDNSVRLEDLVQIGEKGNPYTISNPLIAAHVTWDDNKGKFAIFAKDDEMYAAKRYPAEGQKTYLIDYFNQDTTIINKVEQADYDQSNWIEILIPSNISEKTADVNAYRQTLDLLKEQYENKILEATSVSGTYVDALNPTIDMGATLPRVQGTTNYTPNFYCTANFLSENIDTDGAYSYREDYLGGDYYFFMDAKPQEFCEVVWAYYMHVDSFFVAPAQEGVDINGHRFKGSFPANMSLCEDYNVTKETPVLSCFSASNSTTPEKLYGFQAIVRKNPEAWTQGGNGSNGAPRRIQPYTEDDGNLKDDLPLYIVYPLSTEGSSNGTVTAVNEIVSVKTIKSVHYYNLMGMESETPFEGINIVVTLYNDGTRSAVKVLR